MRYGAYGHNGRLVPPPYWDNQMGREVDITLAQYRGISSYRPNVGDLIIRHGWLRRTVWFGIISYIDKDGNLHVLSAGIPRLLVTMPESDRSKNTRIINPKVILDSWPGSYSVLQQQASNHAMVWHV